MKVPELIKAPTFLEDYINLTVRKILCRNRVWGDRNFSRFFFIPNWEKIIICPKRVRFGGLVAHNIEIHLTTPCICPGRISGPRRFFAKFRLWVPKIDFSQIGQISRNTSKMISRCSLRLVWPPTTVVSWWTTFKRIKIFDNFWDFGISRILGKQGHLVI